MTNPTEKMKLPKCHKCKRETSMLFCSDCVQEAIKYDRKEILEIIEEWWFKQNDGGVDEFDVGYVKIYLEDIEELKSKIKGEKLK